MTIRIGLLLFPDAEELDWAGPYEVFTMAALGQDVEVVTIAEHEGAVRGAKGLRVLPDCSFTSAPELDVVLVPGGQGSRIEMENPVMLDWLRKISPRCSWITSVCTGAAILAKTGLLDGRRITTHWGYIPTLRELAPECEVLEEVRYVEDGNVITAAGVSAGIDMALFFVGKLFSVDHARNTQRMMEYDPAPPYGS